MIVVRSSIFVFRYFSISSFSLFLVVFDLCCMNASFFILFFISSFPIFLKHPSKIHLKDKKLPKTKKIIHKIHVHERLAKSPLFLLPFYLFTFLKSVYYSCIDLYRFHFLFFSSRLCLSSPFIITKSREDFTLSYYFSVISFSL